MSDQTNNPISNAIAWVTKEFKQLITWIGQAEEKLKPALVVAENLLNGLKSFTDSGIGKTVISIIEAEIPASTGLLVAFQNQLPIWLAELNWINNEGNKTLDEQWKDALAYLSSIKDPDVYASQLNTLKALFTKFFGTNEGLGVTIQQALTIAQPSHSTVSVIGE
jgi:hypothetical protein